VGFYLDFIRTVFQTADPENSGHNNIVAFTSSLPGEGVTHVVNTLAVELAGQTQRSVLVVESPALKSFPLTDKNQLWKHCHETEIDNLFTLPVPAAETVSALVGPKRTTDWDLNPEFRVACLRSLVWNFDYVLVDCPSLAVSSEATSVAPLVDGTAVIVEAGKTRRNQIRRSQQMIETAGGNFLGYVLNQRSYPVPRWLYRFL
jgi:hypothetical protein